MRDRWHDVAQTVRHLAVLTDFVPLNWHDLARYNYYGNIIRTSVMLALVHAIEYFAKSLVVTHGHSK